MVCVERMMAIICPLKARNCWSWQNLKFIVLIIWITGALASMHSHVTHNVTVVCVHKFTIKKFIRLSETELHRTTMEILVYNQWFDPKWNNIGKLQHY